MASTISYSRTKHSVVPAYSALAILVLCVIALLSYLWKQDAPREGVVLSKFAQHPYPGYFQPVPAETTLPIVQAVVTPTTPAAKAPEGEASTSEPKVAEVPRYGADASTCTDVDYLENMPTKEATAEFHRLLGQTSWCMSGSYSLANLMSRPDFSPTEYFVLRDVDAYASTNKKAIEGFISSGLWSVYDLERLFEEDLERIGPDEITLLIRTLRDRGSPRIKELWQMFLNRKMKGLCEAYFYERISPEKEQQERDFFCK
jgi:hypothetical protein